MKERQQHVVAHAHKSVSRRRWESERRMGESPRVRDGEVGFFFLEGPHRWAAAARWWWEGNEDEKKKPKGARREVRAQQPAAVCVCVWWGYVCWLMAMSRKAHVAV